MTAPTGRVCRIASLPSRRVIEHILDPPPESASGLVESHPDWSENFEYNLGRDGVHELGADDGPSVGFEGGKPLVGVLAILQSPPMRPDEGRSHGCKGGNRLDGELLSRPRGLWVLTLPGDVLPFFVVLASLGQIIGTTCYP